MKLIYYRWSEDRMWYVVEELTEAPNGRLKHHAIESKIFTETDALNRVRTLRAMRDGTTFPPLDDELYPTDNADLSHSGSQ